MLEGKFTVLIAFTFCLFAPNFINNEFILSFSFIRYTCYAANKAGNVSSSVIIRVIQPENTGEESLVLSEKDEQVGIILATILVFLLLVLSACFIVLRHKTSFLSRDRKSVV